MTTSGWIGSDGVLRRWQVVRGPAYAVGALVGAVLAGLDRPALAFVIIGAVTLSDLVWAWRWGHLVASESSYDASATFVSPRDLCRAFASAPGG